MLKLPATTMVLVVGQIYNHHITNVFQSQPCIYDVLFQELIPEFFCLPEMFTNMNGYKVQNTITFVDKVISLLKIQKLPVTQFNSRVLPFHNRH